MTLFREINSLLFGLFLLVMSSLVYFQFTQTRDFMNLQMESDLNNTMTSLGLMLQPHIETGDVATAETLVNVIFEGGFYRKVTLTWLVDSKEQVWENPVTITGVPNWFIDLHLFSPQKKSTLITSGWMQLATLEIEGHPALGYRELWRVMNDTLMVLSFLFIISIVILRFKLKRILAPLNTIANQAKRISQRRFGQDIELPKATELQEVVVAINSMSGQLQQIFSTLDEEVNELKENKLIDQVSHLPNRQYLSAHVNSWLNEPGFGGLILAKFDWIEDVYNKYGFQGRDEIIKVISKRMQNELPDITECFIARVSTKEFAFLITKAEKNTIEIYLQSLIRLINQEITKAGCIPNSRFAIGVSQRIENMTSADLMSQSDNALQQAQRDNKITHWITEEQPQKYSREQWRNKLVDAIKNNHFIFQWQPILQLHSEKVIQREIYCRLEIDQQIVSASEFMPFIELLSLGAELDKCVLNYIEQKNILALSEEGLAINLTHDSIQDPEFTVWLEGFLAKSTFPDRMLFEIPESAAIGLRERCYHLTEVIREAGAKLGIDQCGRHIGSLDYLQKIHPDYIKLDLSFAFYDKLDQNKEICKALVNVAKGLNIDVIITGIEDTEQLTHFNSLKAQGFQGYINPIEEVTLK